MIGRGWVCGINAIEVVVKGGKFSGEGSECDVIVFLTRSAVAVRGEEEVEGKRAVEEIAESYKCAAWVWEIE